MGFGSAATCFVMTFFFVGRGHIECPVVQNAKCIVMVLLSYGRLTPKIYKEKVDKKKQG
jgi:hypothetical protein